MKKPTGNIFLITTELRAEKLLVYYHIIYNSNPEKPLKIPNFVGLYGAPVWPPTESYARHTIIVYKPWRKYPHYKKSYMDEFNKFIVSAQAPASAKLQHLRVLNRWLTGTENIEPTAEKMKCSMEGITPEDEEFLTLVGLKASDDIDYDNDLIQSLDKGLEHDWDKPPKVRIQLSNFKIEL